MACYVVRMLRKPVASESGHGPAKGSERRSFGRLRQERSGRWSAAYTGPDMGLHRAPATFHTKDAAVAWLAAEQKLIDLDAWTPPDDRSVTRTARGPTFGEFAAEWLETRRTRRGPIKPRTRADYQRLLDRHLLPTFGRVPLRHIKPADVDRWYLKLDAGTPTERARVPAPARHLRDRGRPAGGVAREEPLPDRRRRPGGAGARGQDRVPGRAGRDRRAHARPAPAGRAAGRLVRDEVRRDRRVAPQGCRPAQRPHQGRPRRHLAQR